MESNWTRVASGWFTEISELVMDKFHAFVLPDGSIVTIEQFKRNFTTEGEIQDYTLERDGVTYTIAND